MISIPKKVAYIYHTRKKVKIGVDWYNDPQTLKVNQTFVADYSNPSDVRNAEYAAQRSTYYDKPNVENIGLNKDIVDNKPINNIKLISLSLDRMDYNVLVDDKYYVNIRRDILADVLINNEVKKGVINAEFIWASSGKVLKLVRVDSDLHKNLLKAVSRNSLHVISDNKLEIGGIYASKRIDAAVYMGRVSTSRYKNTYSQNKYRKINGHLFCYLTIQQFASFSGLKSIENINPYSFKLVTNHSFREKIGSSELNFDAISWAKNLMKADFKTRFCKTLVNHRRDINYLYYRWQTELDLINMYKFGSTPLKPFDVKKYIILS